MRPEFDADSYLWTDDGSLRDIYVQQMQAKHWQRFDSLVCHHEHVYRFDGDSLQFPGSDAALANRDGSHVLSLMLGHVRVNCHFFVDWQLEIDISPREILGHAEHAAVMDFVEQLSLTLELPADITPENEETNPFMSYSPVSRAWTLNL